MAGSYRSPGVYVEDVTSFSSSVVPVATAIPAFFGYTAVTQFRGESLVNRPRRIASLLEFEQIFGKAPLIGGFAVTVDVDGNVIAGVVDPRIRPGTTGQTARFTLHHAMRLFYANGGGDCHLVSLGDYSTRTPAQIASTHRDGLDALALEDEPTLIVMPDLSMITPVDSTNRATYHGVLIHALRQCSSRGDRFLIADILGGDRAGQHEIDAFRDGIGTGHLKYGAVYHPYLQTTLPWPWDESAITVAQDAYRADDGSVSAPPSPVNGQTLTQLREGGNANPVMYGHVRTALDRLSVPLPPSPAVAGVYATVDRTRGVFKAPANVSLASIRGPMVDIDDDLNEWMTVHPSGKSVNAIRAFTGRGTLVWGARTLDGNSTEWRYVNVRRFFNMVEESTKKATVQFVTRPNTAATWSRVRAMIENFLIDQWRGGALAGATPDEAFYVRVGLGTTMTAQDVLEGRMNVEIGMAVLRPAEFSVLRFSRNMHMGSSR